MSNDFILDPRLENDTDFVIRLSLCEVRLMNDAQYPWLILVPSIPNLSELHQLSEAQQSQLNRDSNLTSRVLVELFTPETLNVAALGNIVRQLHIHHVARFSDDPAWPGPIWGKYPVQKYDTDTKINRIALLKEAFVRLAQR